MEDLRAALYGLLVSAVALSAFRVHRFARFALGLQQRARVVRVDAGRLCRGCRRTVSVAELSERLRRLGRALPAALFSARHRHPAFRRPAVFAVDEKDLSSGAARRFRRAAARMDHDGFT